MEKNSVWFENIVVHVPSRGTVYWDVDYSLRYDKEFDQFVYKVFFDVIVAGKVVSKDRHDKKDIIKSLKDSSSVIRNSFEKEVLNDISSEDIYIMKEIGEIVRKTTHYVLTNLHRKILEIPEKKGLPKKIEDLFKAIILFPTVKSKKGSKKDFRIFSVNTEETEEILDKEMVATPDNFSPTYSRSDFKISDIRRLDLGDQYKIGNNYFYDLFSILTLGFTVTLPNFTKYFIEISEKMNIKYIAFLGFGNTVYPTLFLLSKEREITSEITYVESLNFENFGTVFFDIKILFGDWRLYDRPYSAVILMEPVLKKSMLRNLLHGLFGEWKNQDEIQQN